MIYRLEKALDEAMRITKKESGEVVRKKMYSSHMTSRLAIPTHPILGKAGAYDTGLTPAQEAEFEELLGYDKGYLSNKSTFWNSYGIKIPAVGLVLNDDIPEDALTVAVLKGRSKTVGDIVFSKQAIKTNHKAKWILSNDETEAETVSDSLTWLAKAAIKFDAMNNEDLENYLKSTLVDVRGLSPKIIRGKVAGDVKTAPKKFLAIVTDKHQATKIFIHELVAYGILKTNKAAYVNEDGITVAYTINDLIEYINNKHNAKVVITWKKMLEEAKK
jgi:hypothetical protein